MFNSNEPFTFVGVRQYQKDANSKLINFVTLGNSKKFQSYDFIVTAQSGIDLNLFQKGDLVNPTFEIDLFNGRTSFNLVNLVKAK